MSLRGSILHFLDACIAYSDKDVNGTVSELCAACDQLDTVNPTFVFFLNHSYVGG